MSTIRTLTSGRDYQLRYALWRLLELARAVDGPDAQVASVSVEKRIPVTGAADVFADVVLADADDRPVEIVECKEHEGGLRIESVRSFLDMVRRLLAGSAVSDGVRFRFVSTGRWLRVSRGGPSWDFGSGAERGEALARYCGEPWRELGDRQADIIWDVDFRSKESLTAQSMFHCTSPRVPDNRELCVKLYALLAAQMGCRGDADDIPFPSDLLLYLFGATQLPDGMQWLDIGAVGGVKVEDVRCQLPQPEFERKRVTNVSREKLGKALRRGVLGEDVVSLEQIYVPQTARLGEPDPERRLTDQTWGEGTDLLFKWLAGAMGRRADKPLLVLGDFGVGKSSLLTWFSQQLLDKGQRVVPLLLPLRDLREAGRSRPLDEALFRTVERQWQVNLRAPSPGGVTYCLLCDGFDELNLYYQGSEYEEWIGECFRSLSVLAQRDDLYMVISSRPILMMDVTRPNFQGAECPKLELQVFEDKQIAEWCGNYRRATGMGPAFDLAFLADRDLVDVARLPIVLYMIARIYQDAPETLARKQRYTKAGIYRLFMDWTCKGGYFRDAEKHRVPRNYREVLRDIAWHVFQTSNGFIEEEKLLDKLRKDHGAVAPGRIPIDRHVLVAHMLRPLSVPDNGGEGQLIEFTHQSFREYLVAERTWQALAQLRAGGELGAQTWMDLSSIHPYGNAEMEFLRDMVATLAPEEAKHLLDGLAEATPVHSYWSHWQRDVVDALRERPGPAELKTIIDRMTSQPVRACNMSILAFLLRLMCFVRLKDSLPPEEAAKVGGTFRSVSVLSGILRFQESITGHTDEKPRSPSFPGQARRVLLQNLEGLELNEGSRLLNHSFEGIVLRQAVLRKVYFTGSEFHGADLTGADLSGSVFQRCFLWFTLANGASFTDCDFTDAILAQERESELEGGDFTGADFTRAQFRDLAVSKAAFAHNHWEGARVVQSSDGIVPYLANCRLDPAAETFFREAGVEFRDCTIQEAREEP